MPTDIYAIIMAFVACIPSAIVGLAFWGIQRNITKRDEKAEKERLERQAVIDKRDERRQKHELLMLKCTMATLDLSEATARAIQRIPEAKANGDIAEALDKVAQAKAEQRAFIEAAGIEEIYTLQK